MVSSGEALGAIAHRLATEVPEPDGSGTVVFELAGNMRLGVQTLPGDAGFVAWSEVRAAAGDGDAAERDAARLLRLRLARLRASPEHVATRDGDRLAVFWRGRPDSEREWLEAVASLLNETEALRGLLDAGRGPSPSGGSLAGLFSHGAGFPGGR